MRRIQTADSLFHDGNAQTGELGTPVTASWLNGVQEELLAVVEDAGLVPSELNNAQMLEALRAFAPAGQVAHFARASAPAGWLTADGSAVSRASYARLFTAIGTTFGAGDGSTTFNVPDLRGEFVRGLDAGRGIDAGRTLGSSQAGDNKAHDHGGSSGAAGGHSHGGSTGSGGLHSHTGSTDYAGYHDHVNGVYSNLLRPPYAGSLTGTDTSGSGSEQAVGAGDSAAMAGAGSHYHFVNTNGAGEHSHTIASEASHSHTITSNGTEARPRNIALLACIKY